MKELNIDILKKYADLGFLTDTSIINACELQPELLKTINVYDYISVTDLGNVDKVESSPVEVEPTTTEVNDAKESETIEEVEPVAQEIPEIVVEEKEVEIEPVKSTKTKKN